jgi:hypothetical protein
VGVESEWQRLPVGLLMFSPGGEDFGEGRVLTSNPSE